MPRFVPIIITADDRNAQAVVGGLTNAFERMDAAADRAGNGGLRNAFIQADLTARAISFVTREVIAGAQEFLRYGRELSNLNTLLDDSASLTKFRDGLLELDPALGQTSELARGMYQAISSGVDEADALQFIADSAKTARAGLATTFETVDAGTSVMASFGIEGKNVMTVYDKMFETVKRGKIELPQLASSIGLVSNVAAQTGLSVDEMFAAIATASRTNRPTVAIEGMRSALVNVIKPSEQAVKLAESLGIQFDAQALKAKGLARFLNEVSEATGGDAAKMAVLFGDVQALNFVMSVTGNQAKTFASDLEGIAAASGTVEEAFQKQKQSLSAQAEELKVTFSQGLIKTFLFLEPLLTGTLSVVNRYPAVFGAAIVVVSGLTAAYTLYNTQLAINAATHLPQVIKGIQSVIFWMIHFRTALTDTQTALTASAGYIGLAVAAIGLLIYAWRSYESAAERANKLTKEQVAAQTSALAENKSLAAEVKAVAAAQEGSADRHERLNAVLGQLDPMTQAYIKSLQGETEQVKALAGVIGDTLRVKQIELESTLRTTAKAILEQSASFDNYTSAVKNSEEIIQRANRALAQGNSTFELEAGVTANATAMIERHSQRVISLSAKKEELNKQIADNIEKNLTATKALGLNRDGLENFYKTTLSASDQQRLFSLTIDRTTQAAEQNAAATNKTTDAINQQANAVFNLRSELQKLAGTSQEKIDKAVFDIVKEATKSAQTAGEAKRIAQGMAREALKQKPELQDAVRETEAIRGAQKGAEEVFSPTQKSGGSGSRPVDPIKDATRSVQKLRAEVDALQKGGGKLFDLQVQREQLEDTKRQLTEILKLRRTLDLRNGDYLPGDLAGREKELRDLNREKQTREALTKIVEREADAQAALRIARSEANAPVVSQAIRTQTALAKLELERRDTTVQTLSEIDVLYEKLNYRVSHYQEIVSQAATAEQKNVLVRRDAANSALLAEQAREKAFTAGIVRGGEVRVTAEINAQVARLKESNEARQQILDNEAALKARLISFELDVSRARSNASAERIRESRQTAIQILLIAEEIKNLREGDLGAELRARDAARLSRLQSEQRTLADLMILRQQEKDGYVDSAEFIQSVQESAELARLNAAQSSAARIIQLQEEIAHAGEDSANRQRIAYLETVRSIQQADEDAALSMIASQAKIADQGVYHATQANAKILDFLAQQKGITDIVADAKIGVIQQSFDGIDSVLDRIIPKAHGFGNIIKQIIADLLKLEASKWFRKILGLDGTAGPGGTPPFVGGGSNGGNWWSNLPGIFNPGGGAGGVPPILNWGNAQPGGVAFGGGGGGLRGIINGFRQGGFMGGLRNLLGLGGGAAAATAGGLPSIAGGAATQFAGGFMPVIPALGGGGAAAGAAGGAAAGGSSMLGSLGALFTNPWTAVVAGAAIGGFMLWKHFKNGTEKKLREAIQTEYQVSIKDMKTLSEIKQIGEQSFGKGQVSKHLQETIRLDQVKQIIQAYAEGTGQKSNKLVTEAQLKDENFAGNRFITRIAGGIIPGFTHGYDHVPVLADGGEYMLRSAVTTREGLERVNALNEGRATITPKTPRPRVPAVTAAPAVLSGGSSQSSTSSSSGMPPALAAALIGTLERVATAMESYEAADEGALFQKGAKRNPQVVADALCRALDNSNRADELKRKLGGGGTI